MPFGLSNAPSVFQRAMEALLGQLDYVKIFVDDVLIFSPSWELHKEHLQTVLQILQTKGASINFDKSHFAKHEVTYLGIIISRTGIKADISRTAAFRKESAPTKQKHFQIILGFINWFRPYIKNLSTMLATISAKTYPSHGSQMISQY